jgi:hypothetical protein
MSSLDMTAADAALKQHYVDNSSVMKNLVYKNNPFLALCPKMTKFGGKNLPIPLIYANPMGRSATFATAQSNAVSSKLAGFVLTRVKDYAVATIDAETIDATQNDAESFIEAVTLEVDGAIQACSRSLATSLFRNGSGSIGQVANTGYTTTALTLVNTEDVVNFEVGMKLVCNDTDNGTTVESGTLTVSGVNRDTGVITTTQNLSTGISTIATNDYIFVEGDPGAKISGLDAWLPSSVTGTSFFGVTRTADPTRLGGQRISGASLPLEEALISGVTRAAREGGSPDYCFLAYSAWDSLVKSLGSKVQYVNVESEVGIGFKGLEIMGPKGPVKVIPDQNCPSSAAFLLQLDTWKLFSLGEAPKILSHDGLKFLRQASADGVELRIGYYAQLGCVAPGWSCRIALA